MGGWVIEAPGEDGTERRYRPCHEWDADPHAGLSRQRRRR